MQERFKRSKCVTLNDILDSANSCRKTRTVHPPQRDDANHNTAESMVKTATAPECLDSIRVFTLGQHDASRAFSVV
jgi:hypothetical protein